MLGVVWMDRGFGDGALIDEWDVCLCLCLAFDV